MFIKSIFTHRTEVNPCCYYTVIKLPVCLIVLSLIHNYLHNNKGGVTCVVPNDAPSRDLPVDSSFGQLRCLVVHPLSAEHH